MKKFISFPSIEQYRNVVKSVQLMTDYVGRDENDDPIYEHTVDYPRVEFSGTVKLHGTNAGIVLFPDLSIQYQSRESVLDLQHDNSGFMNAMLQKSLLPLFDNFVFTDHIAIFGEWCGKGIQKGVGISQLDKMFVIFGLNVDGVWRDCAGIRDPEQGIYNIKDFETYSIVIDFNKPESVIEELTDITNRIEQKCPVAASFGVTGVGEGAVYIASIYGKEMWFKIKGEKHQVSKTKEVVQVDPELLSSIEEFLQYAVTTSRLEQGLEKIDSLDIKNIGAYLKWLVGDIMKEEADVMTASGIEPKMVNSRISAIGRMFFMAKLNEF